MRFLFTLLCCLALADMVVAQSCNCDLTVTRTGLYDAAQFPVRPGGTVCIQAGTYEFLRFRNYRGAPGAPIRFVNCGGLVNFVSTRTTQSGINFLNCHFFRFTGTGHPGLTYGFRVSQTGQNSTAVHITSKSSDCEIDRIEVAQAGFAGIMIKTDPDGCDASTWRGNFVMRNVRVHDNYIHDVIGEGLYIGNSFWNNGMNRSCNGQSRTVFPHEIHGLLVYNNVVERSGCEGIQYSCAPGAQVYNNRVISSGRSPFANFQNNGVQIGGGVSGAFYNNTIEDSPGNGLIVVGHLGNLRIYNNIISDSRECGVFCDERNGSLANVPVDFVNNTIISTRLDGIRLYNETQRTTVTNNTILAVGTNRYVSLLNSRVPVVQQNNFTSPNVADARFINAGRGDFRPGAGSPLIDGGQDATRWGVVADIANNARPRGRTHDIGAFEEGASAVLVSRRARVAAEPERAELAEPTDVVLVRAYPSPCTDQLSVRLSNEVPLSGLVILDQSGRVRAQHQFTTLTTEQTIPVSQLTTGTYLIRISTAQGYYVGRFLKQ